MTKRTIFTPPIDILSIGGKRLGLARHLAAALLLLSGTTATQAQTAVTFNDGIRYSQWAINEHLYDFYGNTKQFGFDVYDANGKLTTTTQWKNGKSNIDKSFDYVAGLVGKATLEAVAYYGNTDWTKPWFYSTQAYATGTPYSTPSKNANLSLDNMNGAKMYFPILSNSLVGSSQKTAAEKALSAIITDMGTYNTNYVIGNATNSGVTESSANEVQKKMLGGWFHKPEYTDQMWCDGLYMGPALLAQIIKYKNSTTNVSSDNDWNLVAKQFTISWEQLHDSKTGLLYHAFTANPGDEASDDWSGVTKNGSTYHSAAFWGRANAWYFLALVDVLEQMPTENSNYSTLKGYLSSLATALKTYQDSESGCWYQVLDEKDNSLSGNYLEGSGSCIITAAYLKAIRLGLLDKNTYEETAKKAFKGCVEQFLVIDTNGKLQLINSCASAGLGGSNKRDGSRTYYINGYSGGNGKDVTKITSYTEGKILGGFIMAATEYERAYLAKESHSVLFTRPLTNNDGTLSAEAMTTNTTGTVSYQWYKTATASEAKPAVLRASSNDTKIEGATNATYTPTETGTYYCEASDGSSTVTSSTMTVTVADSGDSGDTGKETESGSVTINAPSDEKKLTWTQDGYTATFGSDYTAQKGYVKVTKDKKSTLTITAPSGVNITKVVLTYGSSTSKTAESEVTFTLPSTSSDTSVGTVTQNSDGSVVITFANTKDIYASKVVVYYGNSGETTTKYTISSAVNDANMGSVAITSNGTAVASGSSVDKGTTLTLTATANEGYVFSSWTVTGTTGTANGNVYTISSLNANTTVTANFTKKASDVEDKTYTFAVKNETYTRNQTIWVDEDTKCARVVLGGWMFPNAIDAGKVYDGKCTSEGLGTSGKDWGSTTSPSSSGNEYVSGYTYQVGEGTNNNARQEQGSNPQPGSTGIYNGSMVSQGTIRDAMFNVPCSGAYLVFTAKVPGTITSTIYQNGVFDKSGGNNQYRPQRRVFVMDEAGQIVPTKAELKNTKGKPESTTWSDYKWDLISSGETLGDELARTHFVNIPSNFSLSSFQNGVYESNLPYDKCKNEVLNNSSLKDVTGQGYRGWSILSDGPVQYTFDVKPGKTYYLYNFGSRIGFYGYTFTPKSGVEVDAITLNENQTSQTITATADGHMATVSLDRTFKGGVWNAAVLPFSMTKQQIDEIFGTCYSTGNENGTQIIYFDRIENDHIYFVRHAYNTIVAGKPFLIKPSKTGDIKINTADVSNCPYVTIEKTTPDNWVKDDTNGFEWVSSFANQTITAGDYYIGTSGNVSRRTSSNAATLKGFRGYLKAQTTEAKQMVLLIGNDDYTNDGNETTGIMALEMDGNGNYVERPLSGRIYNANGQLVATDASAWSTLPNGLYIINGKKYVK